VRPISRLRGIPCSSPLSNETQALDARRSSEVAGSLDDDDGLNVERERRSGTTGYSPAPRIRRRTDRSMRNPETQMIALLFASVQPASRGMMVTSSFFVRTAPEGLARGLSPWSP